MNNAAIDKALFHLTHTNGVAETNLDELKMLAAEHPYFATAQFLLAAKLNNNAHFSQTAQLQKTALYFTNPQWMQLQLSDVIDNNTDNNTFITSPENTNTAITQPIIEDVVKEEIKKHPIEDAVSMYPPQNISIPTVENVKELLESIDSKPEKDIAPEIYPEFIPDRFLKKEDAVTKSDLDSVNSSLSFNESSTANTIKETDNPQQENINAAIPQQKLSSILSNQLAELNKPVEANAKLDFEMEPYYTIDYFASQGIKADLTQQPQDKLTQQLLKFTDWLKKMKNINPNPQDLGTDPELEKAISGIANASNEAKEIVTETMAEVFMKQGKVDKAVQLFIKLSFLEPEKSAYFAAKIQQLKGM